MNNKLRIIHPEHFQGSFKKSKYFEGWYYKLATKDYSRCLSIIPGMASSFPSNKAHAFIQIIDSELNISEYCTFDIGDAEFNKSNLDIKIGSCNFSFNQLELNNLGNKLSLDGKITFSNHIKFPKRGLFRGIMGPFLYVPFMECYHEVISLRHNLEGNIIFNGKDIDFTGGIGYIEKDWGTSFPSEWIWIQGNQFLNSDTSFMLSIARIPWLGSSFTGVISYVWKDGKYHSIATYNGGKINKVIEKENDIFIEVSNKNYKLQISLFKNLGTPLIAPSKGAMDIEIKEIIRTNAHITFWHNSEIIFRGECPTTSAETHGDITSLI